VTLGREFLKLTLHVTPAAKNKSLKSRDAFSLFLFTFLGKVARHVRKDGAVLEGTGQPTGTYNG